MVVCVVGCVESADVECGGGVVCAGGRVCAKLTDPDENICVLQEQLDSCAGKADDDECSVLGAASSSCQGGACVPIVCGNKRVERGEVCDDGGTLTGDGICAGDCRSDETCGNGAVDALVLVDGVSMPNEQCDDSNHVSGDGCSSTCIAESLRWAQVGQPIIPLEGAAVAYDPARKRVVLFGGRTTNSLAGNAVYSDATYEWDGSTWSRIPTVIGPSPRSHAGMVYDAERKQIVLYGGLATDDYDQAPYGDTWLWDGSRWTRTAPATNPLARAFFTIVYDSVRKRVVMFGGLSKANGAFSDTWTWDGSTWTQLVTNTPPDARSQHAMAFDPKRGVIVVAGGNDDLHQPSPTMSDTWELSDTTWTRTTTTIPAQLDGLASMAYDPVAERVIAYGGSPDGGVATANTLAYDHTTGWSSLGQSLPGARLRPSMVTDPAANTVLLFGGLDNAGDPLGETYLWSGSAWTAPAAPPMAMKAQGLRSAWDPATHRIFFLGGRDETGAFLSSLRSFDGLRWTAHSMSGGPGARSEPGVVFDRARGQLVTFGGVEDDGMGGDQVVAAQTWLWTPSAWSSAATAAPPSRFGQSMIYDSRRKVVVMFGGLDANDVPMDDTWEWDGTSWKQIVTSTHPTARLYALTTYDEARGVMIVGHGFSIEQGMLPTWVPDTWTYDGTWTRVTDVSLLDARLASLAYDPASRQPMSFGGQNFGGGKRADTWSWSGTEWVERFLGSHPRPLGNYALVSSPDGQGVVLFGGTDGDGSADVSSDMWNLRYENDQPREQCWLVTDHDGDGLSGCEDPDCWQACAPACLPGTPCDMADPHCGDGVCNAAVENCRMCPGDCTCTPACGDTFCDTGETQASCPGDCTP
jgi:cysteine-rich repeat protein